MQLFAFVPTHPFPGVPDFSAHSTFDPGPLLGWLGVTARTRFLGWVGSACFCTWFTICFNRSKRSVRCAVIGAAILDGCLIPI